MEPDPKAKAKEQEQVKEEVAAIPARKERVLAADRDKVEGTGTGRAKAVGKVAEGPKAAGRVPERVAPAPLKKIMMGEKMNTARLYEELKAALEKVIVKYDLAGETLTVNCRVLSVEEAIGTPRETDYPIVKGKEVMVEAVFRDGRGQAFSDEFENATYTIENLLELKTDSTRKRASFISGLNAVYRHLGLCEHTIHCRDEEPRACAGELHSLFPPSGKVLLVGFQPRFLETLAAHCQLRVLDLDAKNIGRTVSGVVVESPDMTPDGIQWCDVIFATGSTLVNGTIGDFLNCGKPAIFYGVTISAAATILNLKSYCRYGH